MFQITSCNVQPFERIVFSRNLQITRTITYNSISHLETGRRLDVSTLPCRHAAIASDTVRQSPFFLEGPNLRSAVRSPERDNVPEALSIKPVHSRNRIRAGL